MNQLGSELGLPLPVALGKPLLDNHALALSIAEVSQPLPKCFVDRLGGS
jgi:hypothetical protein